MRRAALVIALAACGGDGAQPPDGGIDGLDERCAAPSLSFDDFYVCRSRLTCALLVDCRAGDVTQPVIGGHARGFNTGSVGVSLLGQFEPGESPAAATPSSAMMDGAGAVRPGLTSGVFSRDAIARAFIEARTAT